MAALPYLADGAGAVIIPSGNELHLAFKYNKKGITGCALFVYILPGINGDQFTG